MFFDHYPYTNFHNINLDWVLQAVKAWGQTVEANDRAFRDLKEANEDFKHYVTNYLQDLDITDEINTKLDAMLASGVLTPYFAPYVKGYVDSWLASHVTPTSPALDSTLTLSGAAARADSTGKRLKDLAYVDALSTPEVIASLNRSQVLPGYRVQGITYDYNGHYYVCGGSVDEDGTGVIVKMTKPDFTDAEITEIPQLGHANDITYYDGYLYVCTVGGGDAPQWGIYKINVNDFTDKTLISNAPENTIGIAYRQGDFWVLAPYRIYRTTDFTSYEVVVANTNDLLTAYGIPTEGRISQTLFRAAGYLIGWVCSFVFADRHYGALTFFNSTGEAVAFKMFPAYHSEIQGAVYADMSIYLLADGNLVNVFRMDPRHLSYVQLKAGDDLNSFTGRGTLYSTGSNVSAALLNSPSAGEGFTVQVDRLGVYNTIQTARTNSGRELYRIKSFSSDTWGEWIEPAAEVTQIKEDLSETSENAVKAINSIEATTEQGLIDTSKLHVTQYWIDPTNNILDTSISIPERLVIIPVEANCIISVSIPTVSTKRVAFCNSLSDGSPAYGIQEITGALNAKFTNTTYKYFVIQLFINSDTDMDYTHYLNTSEISVFTAIDSIARKNIDTLLGSSDSLFHTENLKSLPILNSFSDIEIVTSAYGNSANFHNLVKTELCDTSNGYLSQTLLGDDGHGNNLYKYVTNPENLTYGAARRFGTPEHPIYDGFPTSVFTVIITTNIHGVEHGGNWVIYNLLKKMLTEDSDMLRFFKKRVKLIWVPYICASGIYENAEGININRDFPTTKDGTCTSIEGNLVKSVIDEYGNTADLHIDIHTFDTAGNYAKYFASWSFTDSEKLGSRSALVADSVCTQYSKKYPNIELFKKEVVSAINMPTTCTYYTQTVYGVPSGTIEGALLMDGSPAGTSAYTSATAYLYDIVTQTICAMI